MKTLFFAIFMVFTTAPALFDPLNGLAFKTKATNSCPATAEEVGTMHNEVMAAGYTALQVAITQNKAQNKPPLTKAQMTIVLTNAANSYFATNCPNITTAMVANALASAQANSAITFTATVNNAAISQNLKTALLALEAAFNASTSPAQTRTLTNAVSTNNLTTDELLQFNCTKEVLCNSHSYWATNLSAWHTLLTTNDPTTLNDPSEKVIREDAKGALTGAIGGISWGFWGVIGSAAATAAISSLMEVI